MIRSVRLPSVSTLLYHNYRLPIHSPYFLNQCELSAFPGPCHWRSSAWVPCWRPQESCPKRQWLRPRSHGPNSRSELLIFQNGILCQAMQVMDLDGAWCTSLSPFTKILRKMTRYEWLDSAVWNTNCNIFCNVINLIKECGSSLLTRL